MTDGTLPSITYTPTAAGAYDTSIKLTDWDNTSTIGDLSADIIANNPGWQVGDQLSLIFMYRMQLGLFVVVPYEVIIDPQDTTSLEDVEGQFAPLSDILNSDDDYMTVDVGAGVSTLQRALCLVHSRTVNGKTLVSKQSFELSYEALYDYQYAGSDEAFQDAYVSYGLGDDYFLATPGVAIGGGVGPAIVQEVSRVAYGRTFYDTYAAIPFETPASGFPARIDIYMESDVEGTVTLTVGGVSLTPSTIGSLISTWVTSSQADTITAAAAANQKIVVAIEGRGTYTWQ
jgi:hypothetical protein